ncbi:MAG: hypothetical protein ABFD96_15935 [Armatimonadia bacterium]
MRTVSMVALLLMIPVLAVAQTYKFDMGPANSPVAPGYLQVTPQTTLDKNPDYGWAAPAQMYVNRNEPTNPYYADQKSLEYTLYSDGVLSIGENTFTFRVQPGRYAVTAIIGDLALGEGRPGNSIWANGEQVVKDAVTDASVKAFTFPVAAPDGKIALRFRADSSQRYSTVIGVTAEKVADAAEVARTETEYPREPVTRETYLRNWAALVAALAADWDVARQELRAEGIDLAYKPTDLQGKPGYREYWGWSLGGGSWERLAQKTGGLDFSGLGPLFREMGIDGFMTNSPAVLAGLRQTGLKHAVSGGAEGFPRQDMTGITLNLMKNPDGTTKTIDRVYSNVAPDVIEVFRQTWRDRLKDAAPGAEFFLLDEPRGMWGAGAFGDYSAPSQALFRQWCKDKGYTDLAGQEIPERGRNLAFYRFYQFRLQSVAYFVKSFIQDTPVQNVITAPGNGDIGPEQMNHNSYWPPAMAQAGLISTCWSYGTPAAAKMHAETIAMAREFGGQSMMVPPLYPEMHTPQYAIPMHVAGISALTTRVNPWHFGGPLNGPDRPQWMKDVFLSSRLAHATSGLTHTPSLYVWCPESIVYNDLVELNRAEADHWATTYRALYDANLDYGVTNTFKIPPGSVVIYSCVRPVLNAEEMAALKAFVDGGGILLHTFDAAPESPDGTKLAEWEKLPRERAWPITLEPQGLRAYSGRLRVRNWETGVDSVKTYLYERGGKRVHLLNNTDLEKPAGIVAPVAMRDLLTDKPVAKGAKIVVPAARYALLAEE